MGRVAILLAGAVCAAGCTGSGSGMLAWQREYARNIPSPAARADALGGIARTAAYFGDAATARAALDDLKGDPAYDEYAGYCAVELNRSGHPRDARRVAKRIGDPAKRQEVLDRLDEEAKELAGDKAGGDAFSPPGAAEPPPAVSK